MAATEKFFPAPILAGRAGFIPAPFQFVFAGEDNLRIAFISDLATATLVIEGRFLRTGEDHPQAFSHRAVVQGAGSPQSFDMPMGSGVLLNLVVRAENAFPVRGDLYARVDVIRGLSGATISLGTLLAGYIGRWDTLAWPGSPVESALSGPGNVHTLVGVAPGAGESAFLPITLSTRVRVIAATVTMQTSAVVANRDVFLRFESGGTIVYQSESSLFQVASTNRRHMFGAGAASTPPAGSVQGVGAFPVGMMLDGSDSSPMLSIVVVNMDPADQLSALTVLAEEWRNPIGAPF